MERCGRNEGSCGSGDLDPLVLNFCSRWRLMVPSQLIRWQDGTKCPSGRSGEEKCNYVFTASCTSRLAFYIDWVISDFSVKSVVLMNSSCRFWRFAFFVSSLCCSTKPQTSLVYISSTFLHTRTVRFVHFTWFSLMYQILKAYSRAPHWIYPVLLLPVLLLLRICHWTWQSFTQMPKTFAVAFRKVNCLQFRTVPYKWWKVISFHRIG
jgi:hypothetical protein